jgi:hypothetical protein
MGQIQVQKPWIAGLTRPKMPYNRLISAKQTAGEESFSFPGRATAINFVTRG